MGLDQIVRCNRFHCGAQVVTQATTKRYTEQTPGVCVRVDEWQKENDCDAEDHRDV